MKSVLRSVKPYWFYLICEGIKKIEVDKTAPRSDEWDGIVYLYCSKDKKSFDRIPEEYREKYKKYLGTVGARFVCDKVVKYEEHIEQGGLFYTLDYEFNEACQLDNWELHDYGKGKPLYAWHISELKIYDTPRELGWFRKPCEYAREDYKCYPDNCARCPWNTVTRPPQSWQYVEEF